ncbi:MAG: hypothetical protein COU51_01230 [Parcubacteria group bacterium CG10_big_fil_rev_8_21_14_0_10_36_14]|nr:MAG: hypothetical protein COU51_01230 [Parcubacteria group bacterium CG10_big_fil_rev_8_21_14_0_10_36_14]
MKKINFLTSDGVKIVGNWFPVENVKKYAVLLHMRPATKESWDEFAKKLVEAEISALAIDLRGHGESIKQNGVKIDYKNFPDGSHADCKKDVDATINRLREAGASDEDIVLIGGSIGANLAIDGMSRYSKIKKGVALSPGIEFLGISTEDAVKNLSIKQKLFMVASADDTYSYDSVKKLHGLNPDSTEIELYDTTGHATKMFASEPELMEKLINWLK